MKHKSYKNGYPLMVLIKDEDNLSSVRLAEALAAKAHLLQRWSILLKAAELNANNPMYWYILLSRAQLNSTINHGSSPDQRRYAEQCRCDIPRLKEMLYKADPNYLPALYRQGKKANAYWEKIAEIDKDNAFPYYIMACNSAGVFFGASAFDLDLRSEYDWTMILKLISQGNARQYLIDSYTAPPSSDDIEVTTNGTAWPKNAVDCILLSAMVGLVKTRVGYDMYGLIGFSDFVKLAAQVRQRIVGLNQLGRRDDALEAVNAIRCLGEKCALSQPRLISSFLIGSSIVAIARSAEAAVLWDASHKERLVALYKDEEAWNQSVEFINSHEKSINVTLGTVRISPTECLSYRDFDMEETLVNEVLVKVGLLDYSEK